MQFKSLLAALLKINILHKNHVKILPIGSNQPTKTFLLNFTGINHICQINDQIFLFGSDNGSLSLFNLRFGVIVQTFLAHHNKITAIIFLRFFVI